MAIDCCNGCVPPKRNPYCHTYCPEYAKAKANHDRRKAEYDRERNISGAIYRNRSKKVYKALRDRELAKKAKGR